MRTRTLLLCVGCLALLAGLVAAQESHAVPACALRLHILNTKAGEDKFATAAYIKPTGESKLRYIITAFHNVIGSTDVFVSLDEENTTQRRRSAVVEGEAVLVRPELDLAVFECSEQGRKKLESSWDGAACNSVAVVLSTERHSLGSQVAAIGNPRVRYPSRERRPFNLVAWSSVSEHTRWRDILDKSWYDERAGDGPAMVLENLHVTRGFSGGPVVYESGYGDKAQWKIVGLIIGGDTNASTRCWALPSDLVFEALLQKEGLSKVSLPRPDWPSPCFRKGCYSDSDEAQNAEAIAQSVKEYFDLYGYASAYPIIDLHKPIDEQVRLYARDEVEIFGPEELPRVLTHIDVGLGWQRIAEGKKYLVAGYPGEPVIPKFRFTSPDIDFKFHIQYKYDKKKPRDVRGLDLPNYKPERALAK